MIAGLLPVTRFQRDVAPALIGQRVPWDAEAGNTFYAGPCPHGLSERDCIRRGDRTGLYHNQRWVMHWKCPHAGCGLGNGFRRIESVYIWQPVGRGEDLMRVALLVCPACRRAVDAYPTINQPNATMHA